MDVAVLVGLCLLWPERWYVWLAMFLAWHVYEVVNAGHDITAHVKCTSCGWDGDPSEMRPVAYDRNAFGCPTCAKELVYLQ